MPGASAGHFKEKRVRKTIFWVIFFVSISFMTAAQARAPEKSEMDKKAKLAVKKDIIGQWRMIYQLVNSDMKRKVPRLFEEHQVFEFRKDGSVKNISWEHPFDDTQARALLEQSWTRPVKSKYSFLNAGQLVLERSPQDIDRIMISLITEDMIEPLRPGAPLLKKDELILTYILPNNEPYLQRVLERMK